MTNRLSMTIQPSASPGFAKQLGNGYSVLQWVSTFGMTAGLLLLPQLAWALDWPQYERNASKSGRAVLERINPSPVTKFSVHLRLTDSDTGFDLSSAIVVGATAYVGSVVITKSFPD